MPDSLTPAQRRLRAQLAAYTLHARQDPRITTAAARANSPGSIDYWLRQVDPALPEAERHRRAEALRSAHFARLALRSSLARRRRKATA